jgi:hypothetical protein
VPALDAEPYRGCDFGDDLRVTKGRFGLRRHALLAPLAAAVLVAGCLGEVSPTPTPAATATGAATSSPNATALASPTVTPAASPTGTAAVATKPAPCPGTDKTPHAAPGRGLTGSSTNWSGYVAAVKKTGVTCVEGSWVEPSLTCPATGHRAVAIWIGIDGFSASILGIPSTDVLVQIGTQANCDDGVASHDLWREILPGEQNEVPILGRVRAGDHISARISYADGAFTLVIYDAETLASETHTAAAPGAPRKAAEWIVEAPATDCPGPCAPVALPKFSPVTFTGARATIGGQRAAINNDSWYNVKLRMVRGGITRTSTGKLLSSGTSFRVAFVHT